MRVIPMDPHPREEQIGGVSVRVADPYIWAAIHSLDSPTDYRECLSYSEPSPDTPERKRVTDKSHPSRWTASLAVMIIGTATCAVMALLMRACDW